MRRSARLTANLQAKVQVHVATLREHLAQAQRELERARNRAVAAIATAQAAGAEDEDLEQLRAAKAVGKLVAQRAVEKGWILKVDARFIKKWAARSTIGG